MRLGMHIQYWILFVNIAYKLSYILTSQQDKKSGTFCIENNNRVRRGIKNEHIRDLLSHTNNYDLENNIAYFSGNEIIRYSGMTFNLDHFTIEFWVQLEGGQHNNVPILTIYNHCSVFDVSAIIIGLHELHKENTMRLFFSLQTEYNEKSTILTSHETIEVQKWIHVAAVYDGTRMTLYINQAKVHVSHEQRGPFLSNIFQKCTTLEVGGDSIKHTTFRGSIDKISIWNIAKSHQEVFNHVYQKEGRKKFLRHLILYEEFSKNKNDVKYYGVTGLTPELLNAYIPGDTHDIEINIPKCGRTICDNPEIIQNYVKFPELFLTPKTLRYRIINIANNNGSNPLVSMKEIKEKNKQINNIFHKYNITWKLSVHVVQNTNLRNKTITLKCYGHCEDERDECKLSTESPGCSSPCYRAKIGNKICNPECNKPIGDVLLDWDGGDCCNPLYTDVSKTCFDLRSPNRAYMKENEFKEKINLENTNYINIYPVKLRSDMLGKATFPWVPNVYSIQGGATVNLDNFQTLPAGNENDIIHELGHNLGLWHVHKGTSDIFQCDDACAESKPSMIHGDLCEDTNPTPVNLKCKDEVIDEKCGNRVYSKTPFRNFMGYSTGTCANQFTAQQQARMHCYIDHFYQQLQVKDVPPSTIPLSPRVLSSSSKHVQLTWLPPIGIGKAYVKHSCQKCDPRFLTLKQYASSAYSPQDQLGSRKFRSIQAVGPPDVGTTCHTDSNAWLPIYGCGAIDCYLELSFDTSVIPITVKVWVTYNSKNSIKDIRLVHPDSTTTSLGPGTAHCDVPYTRRISTTRYVKKVQIFVNENEKPAIDAVQLVSEKNNDHCKKCNLLSLKYNIFRSPPFKEKDYQTVNGVRFMDNEISNDVEYQYRIQALSGEHKSLLSPPLSFKPSAGYCGDGIIEKKNGEECDDGNVRNGDGCNINCKIEAIFNCKLQPSLCYRHDRDGICENFEKETSVRDCGFYTPTGFTDQWAIAVVGRSDQSTTSCPESVIKGKPCLKLKCVSYFDELNTKKAWRPCKFENNQRIIEDYWIEATYENEVIAAAVVIYLASDGLGSSSQTFIEIELKDTNGAYHKATNKETSPNCKNNPMAVHVMHDMTQPVFKTNGVRIKFNRSASHIGISAVALRSANTEYYHKCSKNELYDPRTKKCRSYQQDVLPCKVYKMQNAKINCTGNEDGDHCQVTCNNGYLPRDSFIARCDLGEWRSTSRCVPVDCGIPQIKHVIPECVTTTYGSICSFKCNKNIKLLGTGAALTCQSDGTWKKSNAYCYATCSIPIRVENSDLYTTDSFFNDCSNRDKKIFDMGTRCRYRCKAGHRPVRYVTGHVTGGNTINILCNDDGYWKQDGYCEKVTCPNLSKMGNYLYNCSNGNKYQSVCMTTCLDTKPQPHYVVCKENGEWSTTFDVCGTNGRCHQLPSLPHLDISSCKQNTIGSTCRPLCKRRSDNIIPDIVLKGNEGSKEEVAIYCMPNKKWFPPPTKLLCLEPCVKYELADGMCDCHNNNQHCNYDGGDCCAQDDSGTVYFFLESSPRCLCIDPQAIKHLKKIKREKNEDKVDSGDRSLTLQNDENEKDDC